MTKKAKKSEDKISKAGAVELTEKELGEAAGGALYDYPGEYFIRHDGVDKPGPTDPEITDPTLSSSTPKR